MAYASCYTPDFHAASQIGAAVGTTAANDRRLVEAVNGTPTFVLNGIDAGRYSAHLDHSAAFVNLTLPSLTAGSRYGGMLVRFRMTAVNVTTVIGRIIASPTTDSLRLRVNSSAVLQYSTDDGATWTSTSASLSAATTYNLEAFVDWNVGTAHTYKLRLNGVEILNTTAGTATSTTQTTGGGFVVGAVAITANSMDVADFVSYNDVAQYGAFANWCVYGLEPTSDGAHSMTANDFQDDASTNLTNSTTTSWSKVDDAPSAAPSVTDFVQQVVLRTTSYMEWVLRTNGIPASGTSAPVLVCLAAAMHPVGSANPNSVAFRLNSGGNLSTEAAIDTSVASNTLEYRKHHYPTEPGSGAAWTLAMANALRARFGYSGDATPPPALDSIMAFVVVPLFVSGTAASSSASSGTAAGTASHHQYTGTAASTSASSGAAVGAATRHQYSGSAASSSASNATATGAASHHQYTGTAASASASSGTGAGTTTHHQYSGSADSSSASSASAAGQVSQSGTASSQSTSSSTATGYQTGEGFAVSTSTSSAVAVALISARAGGRPSTIPPVVRFPHEALAARSLSRSRAASVGTASRGRAQVEEDDVSRLLGMLGFRS